jgi:WhiB family redox-sensing transcriptional regulator
VNNSWMVSAQCRTHPYPDMWFSPEKRDQEAAKAICGTCQVQTTCLEWALEKRCTGGVWGGQLLNQPPAPTNRAGIRHGTDAGYKAHSRRRQRACDPCINAHRAANRGTV